MDAEQFGQVAAVFPFLRDASPRAVGLLTRGAQLAALPAGAAIARPGDECRRIAFVLAGEARAHTTSQAGRDLTLYRIFPGQTCVLTAMCMMGGHAFPASVDTEADTAAMLVPTETFHELFDTEEPWRRFVFQTLTDRVGDLLGLIDTVVFTDLPSRLADALLTQQQGGAVELTHEQLAHEVGSSREVVSRVLKGFERDGLVSLTRGRVLIRSAGALARLATR